MQEHVFTLYSNKPVKITILVILWAISASNIFSKRDSERDREENKQVKRRRKKQAPQSMTCVLYFLTEEKQRTTARTKAKNTYVANNVHTCNLFFRCKQQFCRTGFESMKMVFMLHPHTRSLQLPMDVETAPIQLTHWGCTKSAPLKIIMQTARFLLSNECFTR